MLESQDGDRKERQREQEEGESDREAQKEEQSRFESETGFKRRVFVGRWHIKADSGSKPVQIGVSDSSSNSVFPVLITCLVLLAVPVLLALGWGLFILIGMVTCGSGCSGSLP